ncbi:MAG: HDOD domain-containing protein [Myxococcota bacterium]
MSEGPAASRNPVQPRFSAGELTLPSAPLGLALVLEAADNEETSLARLGWLVNREPGLATHILRLSNSAAYGVGRAVGSVSQATVLLGSRTVRNMTLSHIVRSVSLGLGAGEFDQTLFWEHSLRRASAAHVMAQRLRFDDPGEAFTAGLIQDLGLLMMAVQWPALGKRISATMSMPGSARRAEERALTGTTHDQIFGPIAGEWGVPADMIRAIGDHHAEIITVPDRRGQALAEILRLGDALADVSQAGLSVEAMGLARRLLDNTKSARRFSLELLVAETAKGMREMSDALQIRIRRQPTWEELTRAAQQAVTKVSTGYEEETRRLETMLAQQAQLAKELENKNKELERLATTDGLTNVANRRELCRRLDAALDAASEGRAAVSVLMIDLDLFKQVNDSHGHDAGDAVLKDVASRLAKGLRAEDFIGRMGGEEFAIVITGSTAQQAQFAAERLRLLVRSRSVMLPDRRSLLVTASVGGTTVKPARAPASRRR